MTDSVFSSPARSWRDVVSHSSLSDSESESNAWEPSLSERHPTADLTIISGWLKFRDQKKWKLRWGVVTKLSPAADCLHLQLYRDSRDRYKQGLTKASLSLQHFLGLETGFTLDKESNTVAIICQDLIVVLAFDTRERLIQWQVKIYTHLGEDEQYLIQISSSPPKAKLNPGPAKLHIQEHRFCLTVGVPPKLVGSWQIKHLRRFGEVDGKFCFEGGSLCGRGEGLYVFLTDQANEITRSVQLASEGKLKSFKRTPVWNSTATVTRAESPRKGVLLKTETRLHEQTDRNEDAVIIGRGVNEHVWPSMETQADVYGHADTSSLADFSMDAQNNQLRNWTLENQLGRCVSCVGKLGLISRCSTVANTPGSINFNPWAPEESKIGLEGMREEDAPDDSNYPCNASCVSVSQKSKYSDGSSDGRTECCEQHSFCQYSSLDNISKNLCTGNTLSPARKHYSTLGSSFTSPPAPCRPPKPAKYRNYPDTCCVNKKKIDKAPMPLPNCDEGHLHETPVKNASLANSYKEIASQFYDTPKNLRLAATMNESFSNYDVPPAAVRVHDDCTRCFSKTKLSIEVESASGKEQCFCHQFLRYPPLWLQLPFHYHIKNQWFNNSTLEEDRKAVKSTLTKDTPVYAQVDLSKKMKNRLPKHAIANGFQSTGANSSYTNIGGFDKEMENLRRLNDLNYMNLEFTNSLRYYENVRELVNSSRNAKTSGIECLNIDLPANCTRKPDGIEVCRKCGHACETLKEDDSVVTENSSSPSFANYVPMSPLKSVKGNETKESPRSIILGEKYGTVKARGSAAAEAMSTRKRSSSLECAERVRDIGDDTSHSDAVTVDTKASLGDSDSGLESDKLSQENDDTVESLHHRKTSLLLGGIRRFSSAACKAAGNANRDSSSSNDSGFSSGSLKQYACHEFNEFEMPVTTVVSTKRHHSFNQHCHKHDDPYASSSMPRRSKSSDPLRDLTFHFHKEGNLAQAASGAAAAPLKSSSAEAELPLCLNRRDRCKDCTSPADTTVSAPYVECRSTSSGTSDMSDYIETLSLSSHSSADVHPSDGSVVKLHQSVVTSLKPRSGIEYQKVYRTSLLKSEPNTIPEVQPVENNVKNPA